MLAKTIVLFKQDRIQYIRNSDYSYFDNSDCSKPYKNKPKLG